MKSHRGWFWTWNVCANTKPVSNWQLETWVGYWKKPSVSQSITFHYKHHLWKKTWRATSRWFPKMLFFAFPQLASLLPLSSPNQKMAGLGLQTIQAAPGARFHAKPVVPGREVMASQWKARRCMLWKMVSSYGNLWKQWGKKHIKMILIDFGYPYSISRVYMKWNICRSLHSKSFWKTRHDLNLLTKWKKNQTWKMDTKQILWIPTI